MNLIEQLGGYDVAKNTYEKLKTEMTDKQKNNKIFMGALSGLGDELTQYRRENNIFEVGDLVVNDAFINSYVYVFKEMLSDVSMALIAHDDDEGACGLYSLRHATDAEIKANKRLEVD